MKFNKEAKMKIMLWLLFWTGTVFPAMLLGKYLIDNYDLYFVPCLLLPILYIIIGNLGILILSK